MQGKTINGFELKRLLGVGGMAEVWYAENEIGKPAAVKILNEALSHNTQIVDRFRNEAVVMVKLDHTNIRQVYGYGTIDGRPTIIMEYLEGDDLKAMMKQGRRFNNDELVKWWNQLVDALNYTHAQGIVHRDIKPSNIFLDKKGNIKLLDFGIAKIRESISITHTGATLGTLMYMSPEQVDDAKHLGPQSDIYSLAVTFVHLLTGKAPYDSTTMSDFKIRESIVYKPLDFSGVSTEWQDFLMPYLAKKPAERPALSPFNASVPNNRRIDSDDATVSNEPQIAKQVSSSIHKDNVRSKKGIWIALALALVSLAIVLVVWPKKPYYSIGTVYDGGKPERMNITIGDNPGVTYQLNYIEGGAFQMGSNDIDAPDQGPIHTVTVSSFFMGETEVTQALWNSVMGNNQSEWQGENFPVEKISWEDCQKFIRKLNKLTGKNFRLPTEAEWEYAARGGNNNHVNSYYSGSNTINDVAWYDGNSENRTHEVKGKQPNALGLYDMCGNVWEWCDDWYGSNYYSDSPSVNPQGPQNGPARVLRGGSWSVGEWNCRVPFRGFYSPDIVSNEFGLRLVISE